MFALLVALLAIQEPGRPLVTAELLPATARTGESVYLRVNVKAVGGGGPRIQIMAPSFPPELQVLRTQDSNETSISLPGGRCPAPGRCSTSTSTMERIYVLLAHTPGEFKIPPIRVDVDGRTTLTPPLSLQVSGQTLSAGGDTREARLLARMEPETVYVGQQSTLVGEVLLTRPPSYEAPSPADFWIQELNAEPRTDIRVVDGQRYVVQRFYRAYFPLTAGEYAFAGARVTYEARHGFIFSPQTRELRSPSPTLVVLPLPEDNRPAGFTGAVGALRLSATVEPDEAAVGDAVSFTIEISGTGNIKALPPPDISRISGVDVLDPAEASRVDIEGRTVRGVKKFTWVLVPERAGQLEIPAIRYTSFDPASRTYRTYETEALDVNVLPATAGGPPRAVGLRRTPSYDALGFVNKPAFAAMQLLPILLLLTVGLASRRRSGPGSNLRREWKRRLASIEARKPIQPAAVEQLLRDALFTLWHNPVFRAGSPPEVRNAARAVMDAGLADRIADLLYRLESIRFAPQIPDASVLRNIIDELQQILRQAWQQAHRTAGRSALFPMTLLLLQSATPDQVFREGITAYEARRPAEAAALFDQYVRLRPRDPAGWYNLGVAHQAERAPARAGWAFLHALQLQPRSQDIRDQVARLGITRMGRRVAPITRLTTNETLMISSLLWWFAGSLFAFAMWRHRRVYAQAALLPLAVAGMLLATWAVERALPPPAIVLDQGAALLATRNLHSEPIRQLQPLAGVTLIEQTEGWARVRTSEGDRGWISAEALGVVRLP
jgi:hypothetical protein